MANSHTSQHNAKRRFHWTTGLRVGVGLMALVVLSAVLSPMLFSGPAETLTDQSRLGASAEHWFGTDEFGRDILSRTLVATRLTLIMSVTATAISVLGGVLLGAGVWLAPRAVRESALRLIEAAVAYPSLVFALLIAAILGPGTLTVVIAIGVAGVPAFARLTANLAATIVNRNFVVTSRLMGVPTGRIVSRHVLPNIAEPLLVMATSSFALSLLEISSLSFVGLGVQSPDYDFGRLLNEGLTAIYTQPLQVVAPSIMLVITGLAAMLIGDGLAHASDPKRNVRNRFSRRALSKPSSGNPVPDALLEVDNLTVATQGGDVLIEGLSFSLDEGEILGVVGESGSGKSITAMAVAGLLPDGLVRAAGTLRLGDLDMLAAQDPRALATRIGLVYQDPGGTFNPALRMGSQLTEVSRVHLRQTKSKARAKAVQALDEMSVQRPHERMGQHPHELSGGMLQRASIASSMTTGPQLLIADEPTTALDVTVQAEVLRKFRKINREHGTAMLFISHDIGVVQELCDKVLVMYRGKIVERLTGQGLKEGHAVHPYTKALLAATPNMDGGRERLITVNWQSDGKEAL